MSQKKKNFVYAICYMAYASIYVARLNLSMASPELKEAGALTTAQIGYLGTAFSVFYATGRLLNGMRADTEQPKKMITTGLLVCAAANIVIGFLPPFAGILLLWSANAFAQSMLWSSVLRMVAHLYKDDGELLTKRLSFMVSSVAAGNIAGILVSMVLIARFGVRFAFIIPGLLTLLAGAAVFATFPQVPESSDAKETKAENPVKKMFAILTDRDVKTVFLPSVFHGMMKDNVTLWMAVYFVDTFAIDLSASAGYVLLIPVVGLIARLLYPAALTAGKRNEHRVAVAAFAGCLLSSVILGFLKNPLIAVTALSLVYAFTSLINSSFLSIFPARFAEKGCMASVSGLMDFCNYLGAAIGSFVFGHTIDRFGYGFMFGTWAVISLLSVLILWKLAAVKKGGERK